jgi:hypothetical protein
MNNSTARILGRDQRRVKNLPEKVGVENGELVDSRIIIGSTSPR